MGMSNMTLNTTRVELADDTSIEANESLPPMVCVAIWVSLSAVLWAGIIKLLFG